MVALDISRSTMTIEDLRRGVNERAGGWGSQGKRRSAHACACPAFSTPLLSLPFHWEIDTRKGMPSHTLPTPSPTAISPSAHPLYLASPHVPPPKELKGFMPSIVVEKL